MEQDLSKLFDQVLTATADGPFFPDWEFATLFGRTKAEYRAAVGTLQDGAALTKEQHFLLHGALNNLLGYPHNQEASWSHWLPLPPEKLNQLFVTLKATGHEA